MLKEVLFLKISNLNTELTIVSILLLILMINQR